MVRGLPLAREETHLKDAVRYRVFGADAFPGNPATLIECASLDDGAALQAHARRLPAGDMAFYAHARADAIDGWHVRFFSHSGEVQLCGHALLALAYHLQSHSILQSTQGRHRVRWRDGRCWVSLPARTCSLAADRLLRSLLERAGLRVEQLAVCPKRVWVARCPTAAELQAFQPEDFDWPALDLLSPGALILTAPTGPRHYALRYFAPWHGKPEDSATGSAQCVLAPYWLREGEEGEAHQLSPAGEALIDVMLDGGRVWISGRVEREAGCHPAA